MANVAIANQVFSVLTIIADTVVVVLALSFVVKNRKIKKITGLFGTNAVFFALIVAIVCTLGSLYYSEIANFTPCKLCWYQRILMYPHVILFSVAYLRRDKNIANYSIPMCIIGAAIALYHYFLQRGTINEILPCSTVGLTASCTQKFFMTYGFITIPFMSLSGFLLILFLMLAYKRVQTDKKE